MNGSLIRSFSDLWPASTPTRPSLRRALGFLEWGIEPGDLLAASYATAALLTVLGLAANAVLSGIVGSLLTGVCLLGGTLAVSVCRLVELLARMRRASALGGAPALLARVAVRMRLTPAPETAAQFGAYATPGPLAASLAAHVRRTANGPNTGLQSFAHEWRTDLPALERACSLVESAGREPPTDRRQTLQRAQSVVLQAIQDRSAAFAASIREPVTALYAMGVLLPLSLVALLPALSATGVEASLSLLVIGYDLLLPVLVVVASTWLLAKRPVAFGPTTIERSHPEVTTTHWHAAGAGAVVAVLAWWSTRLVLPHWTGPLAATGFGIGAALLVAYQPMQSVRERGREIDDGLADALSLIGRRVERGTATERALEEAASELPGATGEVIATAARRQRRLGVDVETAFTGPNGVLATVASDRAQSAAALLALSASEGAPAGEAMTAMADHLETLDEVERESRRAIGRVTGTLSNTAAVFGPLVGGATVALSAALGRDGPMGGSIVVADIGLAVGWYVLVLAVVLTALATGLTRGLDRSLVCYRVGLTLPAATATYLASFVAAGLFV